jgi:twitching motility protein PilT
MPQLDPYLSLLAGRQAEALALVDGEPAALRKDGASRAVTKQPLAAPQILALLREIAPPDAAASVAAGAPCTFRYAAAESVFAVTVAERDGRLHASIALVDGRSAGSPDEPERAATPVDASSVRAAAATPAGAREAASPAVQVSALTERRDAARAHIDSLLRLMVERKASDLHLRCSEPPILRADGDVQRIEGRPPIGPEEMEAMLLSIMPERNRHEYAETNDSDFAYEIEGVARFRANVMRERLGPGAVFRTIPATVVTVEQMGVTPEVQALAYLSKGLVLVTGPTGSGKSTTLCALVDLVNRERSDHVITIEDPIEFVHKSKKCLITQRQVGVHTGSFKSALRAALREDPDIVLVGELRDLETVAIAIETAETGHLVFGTLHTTTAASTIDRLIDQFPADRQEQIRVMLSESLKGVISQTLCKKIGGGRVAAREILLSTPAISNLIREAKTFQIPSAMQTSRRLGMIILNDALIDLVDGKLVEPKEAYIKAIDKINFANLLRTRGHDTSFLDGDSAAKADPAPPPAAGDKRPAAGAKR